MENKTKTILEIMDLRSQIAQTEARKSIIECITRGAQCIEDWAMVQERIHARRRVLHAHNRNKV